MSGGVSVRFGQKIEFHSDASAELIGNKSGGKVKGTYKGYPQTNSDRSCCLPQPEGAEGDDGVPRIRDGWSCTRSWHRGA